jgi:hypothetical protein
VIVPSEPQKTSSSHPDVEFIHFDLPE